MSRKQKLPGLTDSQEQAINVLLDNGLLPEPIDGLAYPTPMVESAVMLEYRQMYPGRSDEELERLLDET